MAAGPVTATEILPAVPPAPSISVSMPPLLMASEPADSVTSPALPANPKADAKIPVVAICGLPWMVTDAALTVTLPASPVVNEFAAMNPPFVSVVAPLVMTDT